MSTEDLSKEQRILRALRKTLGNVIKDVTPRPGQDNPLSENTILDIRDCFAIIAERERELAGLLELDEARPFFRDGGQQPSAQVIQLVKPGKKHDDA